MVSWAWTTCFGVSWTRWWKGVLVGIGEGGDFEDKEIYLHTLTQSGVVEGPLKIPRPLFVVEMQICYGDK